MLRHLITGGVFRNLPKHFVELFIKYEKYELTIEEIRVVDAHVHVKRRKAQEVFVALLARVALLTFCLTSVCS